MSMTTIDATLPSRHQRLAGIATLALWQWRQTRGLFIIILLGLIATVTLISAMPFFSRIAMTEGLRDYLGTDPTNLTFSFTSETNLLDLQNYQYTDSRVQDDIRHTLAPYLNATKTISTVQVTPLTVLRPDNATLIPTLNDFTVLGSSLTAIAPRVHVIAGRLPVAQSSIIEIAILKDTADALHLVVGSTVMVRVYGAADATVSQDIPLHVVGLIAPPDTSDPYWQANNFATITSELGVNSSNNIVSYKALASRDTLLNVMAAISRPVVPPIRNRPGSPGFAVSGTLSWLYQIDPNHLDITQINGMMTNFTAFQANATTLLPSGNATGRVFPPDSLITAYDNEIVSAQIPIIVLISCFILVGIFFASFMADLLIEHQTDAIALFRSRGFSRQQIFGAFLLQGMGSGLIAFFAGLALAIPMARAIAFWQLPTSHHETFAFLDVTFGETIISDGWLAAIAVICVIITFVLAIARATHLDVLGLRREATRDPRVPLWRRFNLDIIALMMSVLSVGLAIYVKQVVTGLDPEVDRLLAPMIIVAPVFLFLASLFISLRIFTYLIRVSARTVQRGRGALAMLAFTQLTRAPRQAIRTALLLSVSLALTIFLFAFSASQQQRALDIAAYQTGADFSGFLPPAAANESAAYAAIAGVKAVSVGVIDTEEANGTALSGTGVFTVLGVDPTTYPKVAIWPGNESSIQQLMPLLQQRAVGALTAIPAIVDSTTWNAFNLSPGTIFTLAPGIPYQAVAEVPIIPQVAQGTGGILVNLQSFLTVHAAAGVTVFSSGTGLGTNTIWLRTQDDSHSLRQIRTTLHTGKLMLTPLNDRRDIAMRLQHEPLNETLQGILAVGVTFLLLLAVVGNVLAAWLRIEQHLSRFALLRALGATPRQVGGVLLWEQTLTYVSALIFGSLLGVLLTLTLVPNLVFTDGTTTSSTYFFQLQSNPPIQVVIPLQASVTLAILLVIGMLVVGITTVIAIQSSLSQTLRLNED